LSDPRTTERPSGRNPLPEGTVSVAIGLVVAGLSAYIFLSAANSALGKQNFVPISQLWFVTFILAPGFFLPMEQELGRALAHRRALGQGSLPVVKKALLLGLILIGAITVVILALSKFLVDEVFHGYWALLFALILGFVAYASSHFTRGLCSGSGRFGSYGFLLGGEGAFRILLCAALTAVGVDAVGWWGLLVGIPAIFAVLITVVRAHGFDLQDGPPSSWGEITPNLGWLLCGSVLAAALLNAGPIAANLLASDSQKELVSEFSYAVLIARVPLFLFQAVQAALLPKLARLAAQGALVEFRQGFFKLLRVVLAVGALGTVGAFLLGPLVGEILFNETISRRTFTLLAISSALYMVAVACAQALIALHGHSRVAMGWAVGMAAFIVVTAIGGSDVLLRVELGLVAGSVGALATFGFCLAARMRHPTAAVAGDIYDAVYDFPMEP
jgi:O-antigen/teichoic acid export membrane protein